MRILVVSQYFWPEQFRINDLAKELTRRGHQVLVLTGIPNYPSGWLFAGYGWWKRRYDIFDEVPVFRVPLFLRRQGKGWQLALNYFSFAFFGSLLAPWYFKGLSFDVIFVYEPSPFTVGIPAIMMRRLKKAPILFWVQDLWPESLEAAGAVRSRMILNGVGRMVGWIYRRCDRVLVQSRGFVEPAVMAGACRERIFYYPNWAENFYQPIQLPDDASEYDELPSGFRVIFAGNLGGAQSLETIVDAANRLKFLPDIQWVMIGDGRCMAWMKERVAQLGIGDHIHFLGRKSVEAMPRYFAAADALLVTLKADPVFARTIPSKLQSYLACGKPVLASLDGEGAEVIRQSGAGLAVAAEDGASLAKAVHAMYTMTAEERQAMGERGRSYFEKEFSADMLISRLEAWMRETKERGLCKS